jgi:hypothetical protein
MKPALNQQATRTTNGTQNWTDASITSDQTLAVFFGTEATANNTTMPAAKLFLGATDLTNQSAYSVGTLDAAAASGALSHTMGSTTACVVRATSSGTENLKAAISATLSNGLTLNQTVSDGGAYLFNELSLAGSDHVAPLCSGQFAATDLTHVFTHGAGGVPDAVIVEYSVGSTGTDVGTGPQRAIIAIWDGTNSASVSIYCSASASPTVLAGRINSAVGGGEMGHQIGVGTDDAVFSIGTITSTQFTLTRTAHFSVPVFVTCKSIRHLSGTWAGKCGIATLPSSGSSSVSLASGLAATPQVLLLVPTRLTSTAFATNSDAAGSLGFGAACNNAGTVQQAACAMTQKNAVTTTVAKCYTSNTLALLRLDNTGAPVNPATASFPAGGASLTPTGSWSSADEILYFTFGILPSTIVPPVGALTLPGVTPNVVGAGATVLTPLTA